MTIPAWGMIPFVVMLGCIAVLPLMKSTEHWWEKNTSKLGVALVLGIPVAIWIWLGEGSLPVAHALVEYAQFITLLGSLFVISGGIFLAGDLLAKPRNNLTFLAIGAVLASFIGTTGAAMLLIRPILNMNAERRHKVHTVVFAILVVANSGGLLTPLGDPPLFLGMLRGVPFTWTFHLFPEWLFTNVMLLITYFGLERRAYAREEEADIQHDIEMLRPLRVRGGQNLLLLGVVVLAVAFAPSINLEVLHGGSHPIGDWIPWRELIMIGAATISYVATAKRTRFHDNEFTWDPILEVAALFIGIFLTMIPALKYLAQVAPKLPLNEITFFVFSGGLSSVLDNAPTYATFFEMAAQLPGEPRVAGVPEAYLVAISLGAVFCGALTYIGNGPNFMVKSVAESRGVAMPSFGGYVVWTFQYMVPVLVAMVLIFIADAWLWHILGIVLALALALRSFMLARAHRV
ncbi:sodium:proton antiporter [Aestuariimicrobium sp. p3-SID1156]|uniref:sodium:proton antiporter n=1 Tax=Aestuariimicrobium sp. p3-SID1156 TaxID=2916038 RepID=UPI00223A6D96|nr:sodium:proton antiporter [Aestuariimicrobium sp. p3-SID1156]MCT1458496.1 sodium:proton antiporter [Aestuariimicrobium sp. p3-SID1156]